MDETPFLKLIKQYQKVKNTPNRVKVGYVVDLDVAGKFAELCAKRDISQSKAIQMLMEMALSEDKP